MVKNINKLYFDKNVYDTSITDAEEIKFLGKKPVVLDFHAKWCGPCKTLGPVLEELDKEYDGKVDIYKMDIEEELEVSQQFGVKSVPTLVFIPLDGKPAIQAGAPNKSQLKEIIDDRLFTKNLKKDSCCDKKETTEDPVSTFNKIITKLKGILN